MQNDKELSLDQIIEAYRIIIKIETSNESDDNRCKELTKYGLNKEDDPR